MDSLCRWIEYRPTFCIMLTSLVDWSVVGNSLNPHRALCQQLSNCAPPPPFSPPPPPSHLFLTQLPWRQLYGGPLRSAVFLSSRAQKNDGSMSSISYAPYSGLPIDCHSKTAAAARNACSWLMNRLKSRRGPFQQDRWRQWLFIATRMVVGLRPSYCVVLLHNGDFGFGN